MIKDAGSGASGIQACIYHDEAGSGAIRAIDDSSMFAQR
jgi:hypothetical protein